MANDWVGALMWGMMWGYGKWISYRIVKLGVGLEIWYEVGKFGVGGGWVWDTEGGRQIREVMSSRERGRNIFKPGVHLMKVLTDIYIRFNVRPTRRST